jgi:hypothetical protein
VDEASFEQVLAAAYVLQQHNDSLRAQDPRLDSGWVLTQVAGTQSLLRAGSLELSAAAKLIADRLRTITDSAGVSISLTTNSVLKCIAESGLPAKVPGSSIASHSLVATERLKNGRVFQSAEAQRDIRLDIPACREFGVQALLAVPVQQSGEVAGLVEVRWGKQDAFHESDVRTSQLMAALVTEVLDRGSSGVSPAAIAAPSPEPSFSDLSADDEQFDDDHVSEAPQSDSGVPQAEPVEEVFPPSFSQAPSKPERPAEPLASQCRVCGRAFRANEAFCGNCSMPRVAGESSEGLQSKWASLWYMQQAQEVLEDREASLELQGGAGDLDSQEPERVVRQDVQRESGPQSVWRQTERPAYSARTDHESKSALLSVQDLMGPPSWDDAIRGAWKRVQHTVRLRISRKGGTLVLASLALLVLLAISALWPSSAPPHLTWVESILVDLGLAQVPSRAPAAPTGNPDVRVWVDVHTALYYCPGSNLYGKTPGGQFATQHAAQQDQFEPATGAVCE